MLQFGREYKYMAEVTGLKLAFFTYVENIRIHLQ